MTSPAKIAANRRNARRSTGPRSAAGKARARRNAFRHGLATPASLDHVAMDRIDDLVDALTMDVPVNSNFSSRRWPQKRRLRLNACGKPRSTWSTVPTRICATRGLVCCPPVSAPHWRSPVRLRSSWPASAMNAAPSRDAIGRCRRWQSSNENYGGRRRSKLSDLLVRSRRLPGTSHSVRDVLRLEVEQVMRSSPPMERVNFSCTYEWQAQQKHGWRARYNRWRSWLSTPALSSQRRTNRSNI